MQGALRDVCAGLNDAASQVASLEIRRAVRFDASQDIARWCLLCDASAEINKREHRARHSTWTATGPPVLLAARNGDGAILEALLDGRDAAVNATMQWCEGSADCSLGGQYTLLHMVSLQSLMQLHTL